MNLVSYKLRTNMTEDENGDLPASFHNILNRIITSVSYQMYMRLGSLKCIQASHSLTPELVQLRMRLLLKH
jgi:hypothetical protein